MKQETLSGPSDASLEGTVERVVYSSSENDWAVVRLRDPDRPTVVTAVGPLPEIRVGERLRLTGKWVEDAKYGRQFRATSHVRLAPQTLRGLERYLASGLVPGVGPTMARRLVAKFGLETLGILDDSPKRLVEVDGIGPVRAKKIRVAWSEQKGRRDTLIFLNSHGISSHLAGRIQARYADRTIAVIQSNPYRLATDLRGIGFKTADRIAASLGMAPDAPERAAAGVLYTLGQASDQGNLFLPRDLLVRQARDLLEIGAQGILEAIEALLGLGKLVLHETDESVEAIYRTDFHDAEASVAQRIRDLMATAAQPIRIDFDRAVAWFEQSSGLALAPLQRRAVGQAMSEKILVITGGPGTGKTTLVRAIVEIMQRKGQRLELAAPTGRAANRLSEATGSTARTIHRLLEFDPGSGLFQRDAEHPLDADLVIVDEGSMIDCVLASHLLAALPQPARLVLVGDVDQLPSVGPGLFLADLIASGAVPVVRLDEIFRQAARSLIVANAHRIRKGQMPKTDRKDPKSDFFFFERPSPEAVRSTILELVTRRIPDGFNLSPLSDIQVLTPMKKGILGADSLNQDLQGELNPTGNEIARSARHIRTGDRVMQIRNNYNLDVFNGEIGQAVEAPASNQLQVEFEDRVVRYEDQALDELMLAYACTVHKSQGSEYSCVVMPIHTQHFVMLQRNLLYTAVTRARQLAILVGTKEALRLAVGNDRIRKRFTCLAERLRRP